MKRKLICFLALCLLMTALPLAALATETEAAEILRQPGQCGEDLSWSYEDGTLTISGIGAMDDYTDGDAPWLEYKDSIETVIFSGEVTHVGACAFTDYDNLTQVDFGEFMHTISYRAFKSCDGLTEIYLPKSFRRFGEESFMNCKNLTQIRCRGGMPSFNANCVWDTYATVFYPTNNPWPSDLVMQLFQAFHGRVQFFMAPEEELIPPESSQTVKETTPPAETKAQEPPVTAPAETVPQTTAPEETQPETTAETIPETTQAVTEPETHPTQPETLPQEPEETVPETQPQERKHLGSMNGMVVCLVLFVGVISFVLLGALIFRRRSY